MFWSIQIKYIKSQPHSILIRKFVSFCGKSACGRKALFYSCFTIAIWVYFVSFRLFFLSPLRLFCYLHLPSPHCSYFSLFVCWFFFFCLPNFFTSCIHSCLLALNLAPCHRSLFFCLYFSLPSSPFVFVYFVRLSTFTFTSSLPVPFPQSTSNPFKAIPPASSERIFLFELSGRNINVNIFITFKK